MIIDGVAINTEQELEPYLTTAELRDEWLLVQELHASSRNAVEASITCREEYEALPPEDRTFQRNRDLRQAQSRSSKAIDVYAEAQHAFVRNLNVQRAIDGGSTLQPLGDGWL